MTIYPPEELLTDFRELLGEHSGENMAEVIWETLKQYDLIGWVSYVHYHVYTSNKVDHTDYCLHYGQCNK